MTRQTKIITGVLAGVALGTAIALVLSSDKGDELKGKVGDWFCDLLDSSKDKIGSLTSTLKDTLSTAKSQA
ncbi:MAG: YtxH domain-containing protein [Pedobacter sp.]|nr:YtxH domain-containing protein [Pedobacter sp.]MDQ8052671.1 YtxH domain-containing protein [Pedobacter sp.]